MPIHTLSPVRLMDAHVSAGFQLGFVSESAGEKCLTLLPQLVRKLNALLSKEYPMVRFSIEAAGVGESKGLRAQITGALNVRFYFPPIVDAMEVSEFCEEMCDETCAFLNRSETLVSELRGGEAGTLARIPAASSLYFLTKERCVCQMQSGSLLHYAPAARISAPLNFNALRSALMKHPGCGISLFLSPACESAAAALQSAAQDLPENTLAKTELTQLAQASELLSMQIVLWGKDRGTNHTMARELRSMLVGSGLSCRASRFNREDELLHYQLIHDPWALSDRMNRQLGGRLAATASFWGADELEMLLNSSSIEDDAVPSEENAAVYAVRFSDEELAALGVNEEDELLDKPMTQEQIDMLRTAVTHTRTILFDKSLSPVMPYAASLGFFYEMMVRACIEPGLLKEENNHRARSNPDYLPWTEEPSLSLFDNISYSRVRNYSVCASIDGKRLLPFTWNVWFNCFKCMRLMRNKVHTQLGNVEREELELMYRLMLFPGHEHKVNALRYVIDHPHPRADDGKNRNLKILHADNSRTAEDLLDFIEKNPSFFEESLLSFILSCARGIWN